MEGAALVKKCQWTEIVEYALALLIGAGGMLFLLGLEYGWF